MQVYKYNDLRRTARGLGAGLLAVLVTAGCATAPQNGQSPARQPGNEQTVTRLPPSPPPEIRRISDEELRRAVRDDAPLRYVVKPGDTLWDIADYFMVKPWYWPELWFDNPDIENPHRIYPGDVLVLTHVDGRPTIRLSPRVRELPVHEPIPTLPAQAIDILVDAPRLISKDKLKQAPYILGFRDQHLIGAERSIAFVRGLSPGDPARLDIVHPDGPLIDPATGQRIGFLVLPVGELEVTRRGGGVAIGRITQSDIGAHPGDRLLPARTRIQVSRFRLHAPDQPIKGTIIATYSDRTLIGQYDVVVLNRGARAGLERGHLLRIVQPPKTVEDPLKEGTVSLPPENIGVLMLFDVNKRTSMGIVLETTETVHTGDKVRAPGIV